MTGILALLVLLAAQLVEQPGERFTHFAGYDLGKVTLSDVQHRYGKSRVRERGDAGEYEAWICYATPYGEIQFNSGEMGGGTDLIGFTISATQTANDCPKLKAPVAGDISGLKLGISKARFAALVNSPVEWTRNIGTASFEYQAKTADGVPLDVSITLLATFCSGKLTKIVVWKIETT